MLDCRLQKTGDVFVWRFQCPPATSGRLCDSPTVSSRNVNNSRRPLHGRIFGSFNVTPLCWTYYRVCAGPSPPHADTAPRRHRHRSAPGAVARCRHPPRPVRLATSVSTTGAVSGRGIRQGQDLPQGRGPVRLDVLPHLRIHLLCLPGTQRPMADVNAPYAVRVG